MKCKLLHDTPEEHPKKGILPAGHIIDHRQAYILVQIGAAVSVDDECAKAAGRTPEQLLAAQRSYGRVRAGIHPDDFAPFDAGQIVGYNPDGSFKPGPNWVEPEPEDEDEDEDEYEEDEEDDDD